MNGTTFEFLVRVYNMYEEYRDTINLIFLNTRVFARMKPKNKGDLVKYLK